MVNSGRHEFRSRASSVYDRDDELSGGALGGVRKVWIPPRAALVGKMWSVANKTPRVKSKKSKAAPVQPTEEVVISETPLGDVEMEAAPCKRSWSEESPDRSPKRMMSLLSDFSFEGANDNSGFLPTRAYRDND